MSSAHQSAFYALLIGLVGLTCYGWHLDRKLDKYVVAPWRPRVHLQHWFPLRLLYQEFAPEATPLLRRAFLTCCAFWLCALLLVIVGVRAA